VTRKIYVTKAQAAAARMLVERSAKTGKAVRSSIVKIAKATAARSTPSTGPSPSVESA